MSVFVFVHGGWGGGWEWRDIADRLREAGHDAYRPTLTGLSERRHLLSPAVNLETHVEDVANLLWFEDLNEVVLCGHSYGGMVVTRVADRAPERLAHIVYIDAFVPRSGESLLDLLPPPFADLIRGRCGDGVPMPIPRDRLEATVGAWYADRVVDHPFTTFADAVELTGAGAAIPRTYIRCTESDAPIDASAERARAYGWHVRELAAHHDAQVDDPAALVELLLEIT